MMPSCAMLLPLLLQGAPEQNFSSLLYSYSPALTAQVSALSPKQGSTAGGTIITATGRDKGGGGGGEHGHLLWCQHCMQ